MKKKKKIRVHWHLREFTNSQPSLHIYLFHIWGFLQRSNTKTLFLNHIKPLLNTNFLFPSPVQWMETELNCSPFVLGHGFRKGLSVRHRSLRRDCPVCAFRLPSLCSRPRLQYYLIRNAGLVLRRPLSRNVVRTEQDLLSSRVTRCRDHSILGV